MVIILTTMLFLMVKMLLEITNDFYVCCGKFHVTKLGKRKSGCFKRKVVKQENGMETLKM